MADDVTVVEATTEQAGAISAIDKTTVHQICSGQVVLNLATAVKELLENSIDAGATQVEIKLKDHGASCIEVADNGSGVEPGNFAGLTLKHHTSKLRVFQDLVGVETFGFRGEALSSLCALSNVSISTRHSDSALGSVISYDHNGKIVNIEKIARSVGTTVTLKNIFVTMPVRLKEFTRNVKKEFSKLCQVLNAYCLISTGVRIICTNTVGKGKKTTVISTKGDQNVRDNIVSVFGTKQASSLRTIKNLELSEEELLEAGIRTKPPDVTLSGFISNCAHGEGRGAGDRQFFFINSRPCDPTKISKVVNEVYHYYNRNQYPFICLDILTSRTTVDVNITPDKRQVFLQNEKYLCVLIKKCLENLYRDQPSSIPLGINKTEENRLAAINKEDSDSAPAQDKVSLNNLKRKFSTDLHKETGVKKAPKQPKLDAFFKKKSAEPVEENDSYKKVTEFGDSNTDELDDGKAVTEIESDNIDTTEGTTSIKDSADIAPEDMQSTSMPSLAEKSIPKFHSEPNKTEASTSAVIFDDINSLENFNSEEKPHSNTQIQRSVSSEHSGLRISFDEFPGSQQKCDVSPPKEKKIINIANLSKINSDMNDINRRVDTVTNIPGLRISFDDFTEKSFTQSKKENVLTTETKTEMPGLKISFDDFPSQNVRGKSCDFDVSGSTEVPEVKISFVDDSTKTVRRQVNAKFSMERLTQSLKSTSINQSNKEPKLKFSAKISPEENSNAEKELQRQISKSDFNLMEVYGQFNLGFIIVGLKGDLFIVDQHATDEKYNFETLQRTTVINSQRMVAPQSLELTAVNENILIDNLDVFEKNGFKFEIDHQADPTKRVKLTSLPISKNWTFGKEDIDELIFLLSESAEGTVTRPSRVRAMFASRACRSSVMIGKALSQGDMRRLIDHMGEIEQPWNCPHGRPTLRHLINLDLVE